MGSGSWHDTSNDRTGRKVAKQMDNFSSNGERAQTVAKAYDTGRRRCEANARRGTGTGTCNERLDSHGQCPRVADHLVEG